MNRGISVSCLDTTTYSADPKWFLPPRSAELEADEKGDGPTNYLWAPAFGVLLPSGVRGGATDGHGLGQRSHNSGEGRMEGAPRGKERESNKRTNEWDEKRDRQGCC